MIVEVKDKAAFEAAIAHGKVIVDFWATWCGPCQMMGQMFAAELPSVPDVTLVKVNVDEAPELAAAFGVMSIPAIFTFKDGAKTGEFVGVTSVSEILATLR